MVVPYLPLSPAHAQLEEGVCARVRIQLSQDVVIARNAFQATLEITNAPDNVPLEALNVVLNITDGNNQSVNNLFVIHLPQLSGVTDVSGTGTIAPGTTAVATWLIVPTRDAAPDFPVTYYVGGEFSYIQGASTIIMPLFPAPILVKPDPLLVLDYFWAKDVYGDDPFTAEIEPAEPFSLGLMVRNNGKGVADNFRIISAQPQIIENEKGLLVDFRIIGTQVNAEAVTPSLAVNLGNIDPGTLATAQWLMSSSLQGAFKDYQADFVHIDGLGNARLSLIDTVNIHELTHVVRVDVPTDDGKPDFLVNDISDDDHLPDTLYDSTGPVDAVSIGQNPTVDWQLVNGYWQAHLTATVAAGWVYLQAPDPGGDQYQLTQVLRSDGREIRLNDNAWTTHRTVRLVDQEPYREHLLHLIDKDSTGSYTLFYGRSVPVPPSLAETTPVPNPGNIPNPVYIFNSTKAGTIAYGGACTSPTTAAVIGDNTITLAATGGGPLAEGTYADCTITVTDENGDAGEPLSISAFIVDLTPPSVTINPVTTPTRYDRQTVTGTVEAGASVSVTTDTDASDGAATVTAAAWSYRIDGLVEGPNQITVTAKDAAGNVAAATTTIVLDPSLPLLIGDCDENGQVTIVEVQGAINMYLGIKETEACVDADGSGATTIVEVQKVINNYLGL